MRSMANSKYGADRKSLLNIFTGLIKSKIGYSSPILLAASQDKLNKIEIIQNKALRIATGALQGSRIVSLQNEANIPPLILYIHQQSLKQYYKLLAKESNHPVYRYITQENIDDLKWNKTNKKKPFILKIQDITKLWNPIEKNYLILHSMEHPKIPPWEPLEDIIFTELLSPVSKSDNKTLLKTETLNTIHERFENHLEVYTDGSKISYATQKNCSTTAGFYIPMKNISGHWKLNPDITIAGAELSAIQKSTNWLIIHSDDLVYPMNTVILTDSQVSLHLLKQRKPKAYIYSVTTIQQNIRILKNKGWKIYFQWIPTHC